MAESDFEGLMLEWVRQHRLDKARNVEIGPETNLIETGVLDSVAFLDLIAYVEQLSDRTIDLMRVDPIHLTSIQGLCLHLQAGSRT